MSSWIPPANKSDGETLRGSDWNALIASLASMINGGNFGNQNVSSKASERIHKSKIDYSGTQGGHGANHLHIGNDPIFNFDLALHAARHASGGLDPLPTAGIVETMLAQAIRDKLVKTRLDAESFLIHAFALTENFRAGKSYTLLAGSDAYGRAVVRSGSLYFSSRNNDRAIKFNIAAETQSDITANFGAGDNPKDMVLIGSDLYVLCGGEFVAAQTPRIQKINSSDVVSQVGLIDRSTFDNGACEGLEVNAAGTILYTSARRTTGQADRRVLIRFRISDASQVQVDFGATPVALTKPLYVKRGAQEWVLVIDGQAAAPVLYRRVESTLAADSNLVLPVQGYTTLIYDGQFVWCFNSGGSEAVIVDPWATSAPRLVRRLTLPTGSPAVSASNIQAFFDGSAVYLGTTAGLLGYYRIPVLGTNGGMAYDVTGAAANMLATDGTFLWSGNGTTIRKTLF